MRSDREKPNLQTPEAFDVLKSLIHPKMIGLEWGCGGSTLWLANNIAKVYSIEHDPVWYAIVKKRLKAKGLDKVCDFRHLAPTPTGDRHFQDNLKETKLFFENYSSAAHVPGDLDFILIDGKARERCLDTALKKLKASGGVLVIDDAHRYDLSAVPEYWSSFIVRRSDKSFAFTAIYLSRSEAAENSASQAKIPAVIQSPSQYAEILPLFCEEAGKLSLFSDIYIGTNAPATVSFGPNCRVTHFSRDYQTAGNFQRLLPEVKEDIFLVCCEDHIPKPDLSVDDFNRCVEFVRKNPHVGFLRLTPCARIESSDGPFVEIPKKDSFYVSLQPAIWRREYFEYCLADGEDAWAWEKEASKRAKKHPHLRSYAVTQTVYKCRNAFRHGKYYRDGFIDYVLSEGRTAMLDHSKDVFLKDTTKKQYYHVALKDYIAFRQDGLVWDKVPKVYMDKSGQDLCHCEGGKMNWFKSLLSGNFVGGGKPSPESKRELILKMGRKHKIKTFVETGTFHGKTVEAVKSSFDTVYSVEFCREYYEAAVKKFADDPKVHLVYGDSQYVLPELLGKIHEPCLFWLDAHGGPAAGKGVRAIDPAPLINELNAIFSHGLNGHVILVDDMDTFRTGKGWGKNIWPKLDELKDSFLKSHPHYAWEIQNEILRIYKRK